MYIIFNVNDGRKIKNRKNERSVKNGRRDYLADHSNNNSCICTWLCICMAIRSFGLVS